MNRRDITTKLKWKSGHDETASYMCPCCFSKKLIFGLSVRATTPIRPDVEVYTDTIHSVVDNLISVKCDACVNEMVRIDRNIIEQIIRFNSFGYRTIYGCGGHTIPDRREFTSIPYVMFGIDLSGVDKTKYVTEYANAVLYVKHMQSAIERSIEKIKHKWDFSTTDKTTRILLDHVIVESNGDTKFSLRFSSDVNDVLDSWDVSSFYWQHPFTYVLREILCVIGTAHNMKEEADKVLQGLENINLEEFEASE